VVEWVYLRIRTTECRFGGISQAKSYCRDLADEITRSSQSNSLMAHGFNAIMFGDSFKVHNHS
jgi:hypothetical protein